MAPGLASLCCSGGVVGFGCKVAGSPKKLNPHQRGGFRLQSVCRYSDRPCCPWCFLSTSSSGRQKKSHSVSKTQTTTARIAALAWTEGGFGVLLLLLPEKAMKLVSVLFT